MEIVSNEYLSILVVPRNVSFLGVFFRRNKMARFCHTNVTLCCNVRNLDYIVIYALIRIAWCNSCVNEGFAINA